MENHKKVYLASRIHFFKNFFIDFLKQNAVQITFFAYGNIVGTQLY